METIRDLVADVPRPGRLCWLGLRSSKRGPMQVVEQADALAGLGLQGDRKARGAPKPHGRRHVTLIQHEHLAVIGALLDQGPIDPLLLRRNLVVRGINLRVLRDRRFRIGGAVLEGTGDCHPCSRMEEALGAGGYQAMRGHGGLTARVLESGTLRLDDEVLLLPAPSDDVLATPI